MTGFAKYLGREGKCVVDETEKGWFITYIDKDPATIARQAARSQQEAAEVDEEVRENRRIQQQLAAMKANKGDDEDNEEEMTEDELNLAHSLIRSGEEPLKFNMNLTSRPSLSSGKTGTSQLNGSVFGKDNDVTTRDYNNTTHINRMKYSSGLSASLMNTSEDLSGKKRQLEGAEGVVSDEALSQEKHKDMERGQPPKKKSVFEENEDENKEAAVPVVKMVSNSFLSNLKSAAGGKGSLKLATNDLNPGIRPTGIADTHSKPVSAIDAFMKEEEQRKNIQTEKIEKESRKDYWLHENIIVKIMDKKLGDGRFYKQKAVVQKVVDNYVGEIVLIDKQTGELAKTRLRMDQDDLETTIPKINNPLLIVNGRNRGEKGILLQINEADYNVDLQVESTGLKMKGVPYEDICKIFRN